MAKLPAMEAGPADPQRERGRDAVLPGDPDGTCPDAQPRNVPLLSPARWPTSSGRQKQEAWTFLVGVPKQAPLGVLGVVTLQLVHARTLERAIDSCLTIPGNYS